MHQYIYSTYAYGLSPFFSIPNLDTNHRLGHIWATSVSKHHRHNQTQRNASLVQISTIALGNLHAWWFFKQNIIISHQEYELKNFAKCRPCCSELKVPSIRCQIQCMGYLMGSIGRRMFASLFLYITKLQGTPTQPASNLHSFGWNVSLSVTWKSCYHHSRIQPQPDSATNQVV